MEIGQGYVVLSEALRVQVPADLSLAEYQIGDWCIVTLSQDRGKMIAASIARRSERN